MSDLDLFDIDSPPDEEDLFDIDSSPDEDPIKQVPDDEDEYVDIEGDDDESDSGSQNTDDGTETKPVLMVKSVSDASKYLYVTFKGNEFLLQSATDIIKQIEGNNNVSNITFYLDEPYKKNQFHIESSMLIRDVISSGFRTIYYKIGDHVDEEDRLLEKINNDNVSDFAFIPQEPLNGVPVTLNNDNLVFFTMVNKDSGDQIPFSVSSKEPMVEFLKVATSKLATDQNQNFTYYIDSVDNTFIPTGITGDYTLGELSRTVYFSSKPEAENKQDKQEIKKEIKVKKPEPKEKKVMKPKREMKSKPVKQNDKKLSSERTYQIFKQVNMLERLDENDTNYIEYKTSIQQDAAEDHRVYNMIQGYINHKMDRLEAKGQRVGKWADLLTMIDKWVDDYKFYQRLEYVKSNETRDKNDVRMFSVKLDKESGTYKVKKSKYYKKFKKHALKVIEEFEEKYPQTLTSGYVENAKMRLKEYTIEDIDEDAIPEIEKEFQTLKKEMAKETEGDVNEKFYMLFAIFVIKDDPLLKSEIYKFWKGIFSTITKSAKEVISFALAKSDMFSKNSKNRYKLTPEALKTLQEDKKFIEMLDTISETLKENNLDENEEPEFAIGVDTDDDGNIYKTEQGSDSELEIDEENSNIETIEDSNPESNINDDDQTVEIPVSVEPTDESVIADIRPIEPVFTEPIVTIEPTPVETRLTIQAATKIVISLIKQVLQHKLYRSSKNYLIENKRKNIIKAKVQQAMMNTYLLEKLIDIIHEKGYKDISNDDRIVPMIMSSIKAKKNKKGQDSSKINNDMRQQIGSMYKQIVQYGLPEDKKILDLPATGLTKDQKGIKDDFLKEKFPELSTIISNYLILVKKLQPYTEEYKQELSKIVKAFKGSDMLPAITDPSFGYTMYPIK